MASCSFTHQGRTFTLTVKETSYSIANNTSDVKWTLSITGGGGHYNTSYARVVVNGVERYNSGQVSWETRSFPAADGSKSGTVTGIGHNSEGKASISFQVQGYSYVYSTQTANGSLKLTDIPRASVPTCNNTTLGTAVTINTNRYVSSFSHTIKIKQGSTVVESISKFTDATKSWTPSIATYAPLITNSPTGTFTIELETFNGSTSIGVKTCSVVLTVPSSVKPTASISIAEGDSTVSAKGWGVYVKGKSKLAVTITGTEAYSSEINNYYSIIEGVPYTYNSYTSNVLNVVGSGSVVANVTDKRGTTSADATKSYTVVDYAKPAITTAIAVRCNASGVETDDGTYMKYTFVGAIAAVSNKNTKRFRIRWKLKSSTTWGTNDYVDVETSSYTCNKVGQILTKGSTKVSFASTSSYDIQFMATDAFETTTIDKTFDTGFDLINLHASGKAIAFGKISEAGSNEKLLELGLPTKYKGNYLLEYTVIDTW